MTDKPKTKKEPTAPLPRWAIEGLKAWDQEGDPDHVRAIQSENWLEKTRDPIGG